MLTLSVEDFLLLVKFGVIAGCKSHNFYSICDKFIGKNAQRLAFNKDLLLLAIKLFSTQDSSYSPTKLLIKLQKQILEI